MCTLVVAWQALTDAPVAVAANRDEAMGRPARPPSVLDTEPRVVAPQDEEAGGTWIGYNEHGVLIGLSNRWTEASIEGDRSRGLLVRDLLGSATADEAASAVEEAMRTNAYAPFNLLIADAETALVFAWEDRLEVSELSPGVHAIMNAGWDDQFSQVPGREPEVARQIESAQELRRVLAVQPEETAAEWHERAAVVLADHDLGVCVHGDGYGTRSSSLISLGADDVRYRFADGPPCEVAFETVKAQI